MRVNDVLDRLKHDGVSIVRLLFTDIIGWLKGFNISIREVERALEEGIAFDGSSIEGFVRIEESDLLAKPDPDTYMLVPWDENGIKTALFICDIFYPDGTPFESDPRRVLRNNLERAASMGFTYFVGPELEFFYFDSEKMPNLLDQGGYFEVCATDRIMSAQMETYRALTEMGIDVEMTHHEVSPSQYEIDLRYKDALTMADFIMITKLVVKQIARKHGLFASFMPKPVLGINGSGMHVHQSLFKDGKNAFYSPDPPFNLSEIGKGFLSGLLHHAREITAVTNQWVNSYKRLVVGYEAPVYIAWGRKNRSALVRVPAFRKNRSEACRLEYRAPDPATNPYLAFSVMLAAGLEGIEKKYPLPDPIEKDIYKMPDEVKEEFGIDALPDSLNEAVEVMARSEVVKKALGETVFHKFLANKKAEWERYRIQVTDYELRTYLPIL